VKGRVSQMTWGNLAAVNGALLGDAGPGPLLPLLGGGAVIAGIFLSLSVITGGMWLVRRLRNRQAEPSRKYFLISLGGAACFATLPAGIIGLFAPPLLLLAAALVVTGVFLVVLGIRSSRGSEVEPEAAVDRPRD
jgi:hypothetical protein